MTRRKITVDNQQYSVIRGVRRTTITRKGKIGIVSWHRNKRTTKRNMKESQFRIERRIIISQLAPIEEKPTEIIKERIKYRSLLAISYDTPLGKVIDCRVWIHTIGPTITDLELDHIMRDFIDWLFEVNEQAAMKIQAGAVEYTREVNREIETDEIQPANAVDNERYGWAGLKNSYDYYAQGDPFTRIPPITVPKSSIETALAGWF